MENVPASRATRKEISTSRRPIKYIFANVDPTIKSTSASSRKPTRYIYVDANPTNKPAKTRELVECLTCLSDDIPRAKSAKLKCGHRMCHSCLKRIFKLSVSDPQHMPPKCCTRDHIPLRHVDALFGIKFKKLWNKKISRVHCEEPNLLPCSTLW
jgi:hypothetical protein